MGIGIIARGLAAVAVSAAVMACTEFEKRSNMSNKEAILSLGWVQPDYYGIDPQYCYASLGWVDCRPYPIPKESARREGYPHFGEP